MPPDIAIRVLGLGKQYTIGHQAQNPHATLRDALRQGLGRFAQAGKTLLRGQALVAGDRQEDFWALHDVSFDVARGDVVGVIGRNGAGKSTLLKLLSRITEPSAGEIFLQGRLASLLEVGTGFHPELTGRENIFLNGAILGMQRAEVKRKFDAIVDFAGVTRFLDTPVKRYSSGMYVRLAFAVAAHLEPEILVVDEVLAVGDAEFQKKCLGKMSDVARDGRTILFVSHNVAAVKALCSKTLLLENGSLRYFGPTDEAVSRYLAGIQNSRQHHWLNTAEPAGQAGRMLQARIEAPASHRPDDSLDGRQAFQVSITAQFTETVPAVAFEIWCYTAEGTLLFCAFTDAKDMPAGQFTAHFSVPGHTLNDGTHTFTVALSQNYATHFAREDEALVFEVHHDVQDLGWAGSNPGIVRPHVTWEVQAT